MTISATIGDVNSLEMALAKAVRNDLEAGNPILEYFETWCPDAAAKISNHFKKYSGGIYLLTMGEQKIFLYADVDALSSVVIHDIDPYGPVSSRYDDIRPLDNFTYYVCDALDEILLQASYLLDYVCNRKPIAFDHRDITPPSAILKVDLDAINAAVVATTVTKAVSNIDDCVDRLNRHFNPTEDDLVSGVINLRFDKRSPHRLAMAVHLLETAVSKQNKATSATPCSLLLRSNEVIADLAQRLKCFYELVPTNIVDGK